MASPLNPRRARLAARLRAVRAMAFRSGSAFAQAADWAQSRVSKLETGTQLPTEADIRHWVAITRRGPEVETELLELLSAARLEHVTARDAVRAGGLASRQAYLGGLEAGVTRIAEYQQAIIPGLVQTAAYARELLALPGGPATHGSSASDIEAMVSERIRRQEILYQSTKTIQFVIAEAALHSAPGSLETLQGQLDRLIAVAGLSTVDLGIVPLQIPMAALPVSSFTIHDDGLVLIETLTAEQRLDDPAEVAVYVDVFNRLRNAAVVENDAIALIQQIMAGLRIR